MWLWNKHIELGGTTLQEGYFTLVMTVAWPLLWNITVLIIIDPHGSFFSLWIHMVYKQMQMRVLHLVEGISQWQFVSWIWVIWVWNIRVLIRKSYVLHGPFFYPTVHMVLKPTNISDWGRFCRGYFTLIISYIFLAMEHHSLDRKIVDPYGPWAIS